MNPGTGTGFTTGASNSETYFVTANGGTYWQPILNTTNGGYHLYSGAYINAQTCLCVGSSGRIRKTTNWGLNWSYPVSNTTNNLYSVIFSDTNIGWLCGQNGFIERTINGGLNWEQQFSPVGNNLRSISFINNLTGWIVGQNGAVLKTVNGGITGINFETTDIPKNFILYQNYPNPFNPITTIKFELMKSGFVKIKICDSEGKLLTELLNKFKEPGKYNFEFKANEFASGIYFCILEFENYMKSKKIILIK